MAGADLAGVEPTHGAVVGAVIDHQAVAGDCLRESALHGLFGQMQIVVGDDQYGPRHG